MPARREAVLLQLGQKAMAQEEARRFFNGIRSFWVGSAAPTEETVARWVLQAHPIFFFSSRRRHTSSLCDWSSDVCSSDLNIGLIPNDPGVVTGRNVEHLPCLHFDYIAVAHRRSCAARNDHAHMFDHAFFLPQRLADVFGPTPSRFVSGAADGHAAQMDNFKFPFLKCADLIRRFKPFQNYFGHNKLLCLRLFLRR